MAGLETGMQGSGSERFPWMGFRLRMPLRGGPRVLALLLADTSFMLTIYSDVVSSLFAERVIGPGSVRLCRAGL